MTAVQLDIFTVIDARPPLCLYRSLARGLPARAAEFEAWQAEHGSFGSLVRAHAWTARLGSSPDTPAARCQAGLLHVDLRPSRGWDLPCGCTAADAFLYRGACRHCAWEGPERGDENPAAEDALDHAWPGWRDMPVVPPMPMDGKQKARWLEQVEAAYPDQWLEDGGPVRTWRTGKYDTRHVPARIPGGGYDVGVVAAEAA